MVTVLIESNQFNELKRGDSLCLKTILPMTRSIRLRKGDTIQTVWEATKLNAMLTADPVVEVCEPEDGYYEVSIEIMRSDYVYTQ